jgi:hypothetical protein
MTHLLLLLMTLGLATPPSDINFETAHTERRLKAVKITERIAVDGKLDEAAWLDAPKASDFIQAEPKEGEPSVEATDVRVLYDDNNLYFGVYAHDSSVGHIVVNDLKKDFSPEASDSFEIVLDTFHDLRNGYLFSTNPAGAKRDAQMINEGREVNASWDAVWYVKTSVAEDGWVAEISIPFRTLKFTANNVQTWGVNFHRGLRSNVRNEDSYWAPLQRIYNLQRVSQAGTLEGLEGIKPGSNLRLKPYITSSLAQNGVTDTHHGDADFGFDAKYGITSGLTWDFTYNTDFSQVEADEQQINLSRFSLFFPEKREFFLENSGIFKFAGGEVGGAAGGRPNGLANDTFFFSRSIGLSSSGNAVPILGGTRLTGRAGPYEIGLMNIEQRSNGATGATNFAIGRVKTNIMKNSDIGAMVMNKEVKDSSAFNRIYGADANFRFGQFTTFNASVAKSSAPGVDSRDLESKLAFAYIDRVWSIRNSYVNIQDNFTNEMGYVPRRGIQRIISDIRPAFKIRALEKVFRNVSPHAVVDYIMDGKGTTDTKLVDWHLAFNFQNGAWTEMGRNDSVEVLTKPFKLNSSTTIPAGVYRFPEWFISARPDPSRSIQPTGRIGAGKFYDGYKHNYSIGATWRANYKMNSSFTFTRNAISLPNNNRFRTNLLQTRFNYSFSTAVFLNALVQYNSDAKQWSTNVRFNIIHRPLSDIFLVYNERRSSVAPHDMLDRAIIAKMTYMLSR